VRKSSHSSWGWENILISRENISKAIRWKMGNGQEISIREDQWMSLGIMEGETIQGEPKKVAKLIN